MAQAPRDKNYIPALLGQDSTDQTNTLPIKINPVTGRLMVEISGNGKSINTIIKTGTVGLVDTYTITYTDSTTSTFTVTNGTNGSNGATGNGIASVVLTSGSHAPGTTDTYTITFTDATTTTFTVYNGTNGTGAGDMLLGSTQTNIAAKTFNDATLLFRNVANTFSSWFTNAATAARTWTLPDKSGTVAMTSDITGINSNTNTGDQTATTVPNTPAGNISATNVQSAINELDTEKAPIASPTFTGTPAAPTPTAGDSTTQIATTAFVQQAVRSVPSKEASKYATTAALPTVVYANGTAGQGATLTGVAMGALGVDSNSPIVGDRILVKNQVSTFQNGIYTVTATGSGIAVFVLTRTLDFNEAGDIKTGATTYVTSGTTLAATTWDVNSADSPVMGTDAITFIQSAGPGSIIAGTGISISGVTVSINTAVTADLSTSQTLTNKTLTSPALTGTPTAPTQANGDNSTNLATTAYADYHMDKAGGVFTGKITEAGKDEVGKTYAPASGAQTVALDCTSNNMHIVSGNASGTAITFTVANATNNQPFIVSILQGGTTVSTIAGWFPTIRWAGGVAPTLTPTLNKRDTFGFIRTGANTYDGFIIGQNC